MSSRRTTTSAALAALVRSGSIERQAARRLANAVRRGKPVLVVGTSPQACEALANALAQVCDPRTRPWSRRAEDGRAGHFIHQAVHAAGAAGALPNGIVDIHGHSLPSGVKRLALLARLKDAPPISPYAGVAEEAVMRDLARGRWVAAFCEQTPDGYLAVTRVASVRRVIASG